MSADTFASFMARVTHGAVIGGQLVSCGEALSYVTRQSSINQAATWNAYPELLPEGLMVGIGDRVAGRYPLVWVETASVTA